MSVEETRHLRQLLVLGYDLDIFLDETNQKFENNISLKLPETIRDEPILKGKPVLTFVQKAVQSEREQSCSHFASREFE